ELVEIRTPCGTRIVDENVEFCFALFDFACEHLDSGHGGDVDSQRDAFAAIFGRKFFRGGLARPCLPRRDIDPGCTLAEKSRGDHPADAPRSAGHQRDAAVKRKQILEHALLPCILPLVLSARRRQVKNRCEAKRYAEVDRPRSDPGLMVRDAAHAAPHHEGPRQSLATCTVNGALNSLMIGSAKSLLSR